jgi:alkylation response protein AidB-like acyl-CoA dehydrogenase
VEAQAAAVDGIAYAFEAGEDREHLLARALTVRFALQEAIESVAMRCAELLGGMAFIGGSDVAYLLCASRALAFHPPGRLPASRALDEYARGGALDVS